MAGVALLAAACGGTVSPFPGSTGTLPIGTFSSALSPGLTTPNTPPPGSNVAGCALSVAHPYPVVLVHATFDNEALNWAALSPMLANAGYCVFSFDYGQDASSAVGGLNIFYGLGEIGASAGQLATEVDSVLAETGASQVDLVGHSQGGMMPRYYLNNLGGAAKVHQFVAMAPSSHGTTVGGLTSLVTTFSSLGFDVNGALSSLVGPSLAEQEAGSPFLTALDAGGDTVPGPSYVVIETDNDAVVTPYQTAFLTGPNVQNVLIQNQCPADTVGHVGITYDQVALDDVLNALGPDLANYQPSCASSGFGMSV